MPEMQNNLFLFETEPRTDRNQSYDFKTENIDLKDFFKKSLRHF